MSAVICDWETHLARPVPIYDSQQANAAGKAIRAPTLLGDNGNALKQIRAISGGPNLFFLYQVIT